MLGDRAQWGLMSAQRGSNHASNVRCRPINAFPILLQLLIAFGILTVFSMLGSGAALLAAPARKDIYRNTGKDDARLRIALPQRRVQINQWEANTWGLRARHHRAFACRHDHRPPHHGKAAIPGD